MDVRLEDVGVRFDTTVAVDGVTLRVLSGSWVALIGPNGAGKTTLLRAIAGLEGSGGRITGGELQRVVLARALAQQAPILILDEPTSALDVGHQQQILELVDGLRIERELTVIGAMHDLTLAGQFAGSLVLLDKGRVVATGTP